MIALEPFAFYADGIRHPMQLVIDVGDHVAHDQPAEPRAHIVDVDRHGAPPSFISARPSAAAWRFSTKQMKRGPPETNSSMQSRRSRALMLPGSNASGTAMPASPGLGVSNSAGCGGRRAFPPGAPKFGAVD